MHNSLVFLVDFSLKEINDNLRCLHAFHVTIKMYGFLKIDKQQINECSNKINEYQSTMFEVLLVQYILTILI